MNLPASVSSVDPLDEALTARMAAVEKGMHPDVVYRAIQAGRLPASRSGHILLVRRRDLAVWSPAGHLTRAPRRATVPTRPTPDDPVAEEEARRHQIKKNKPLIELLRQWREEGDEEEQRMASEAHQLMLAEKHRPVPWTDGLLSETERKERARRVVRMLDDWMADESGHDEEYWPKLRAVIEQDRLSARPRFDGNDG